MNNQDKQIGPMGIHEKKARETRVLEHEEERENGGILPPEEQKTGSQETDMDPGEREPRPVTPPEKPAVQNRVHR